MASTRSPSSSSRPAYSSTAASLVSGGVRNGFSEAKASHSSTVPNARWSCANVGEVKRLSGFRGGAEPRVKEDQTDPFLSGGLGYHRDLGTAFTPTPVQWRALARR